MRHVRGSIRQSVNFVDFSFADLQPRARTLYCRQQRAGDRHERLDRRRIVCAGSRLKFLDLVTRPHARVPSDAHAPRAHAACSSPALTAQQLRRLEVFRVSNAGPGCFLASSDAVVSVLEQCPALQLAVWKSDWTATNLDVLHEAGTHILNQAITRSVHDVADEPLRVAARLPFLSAVRFWSA
jgi:hypothetical protein